MKAILQWLLRWLYRFRAYNTEVLNTPGPVLLLPNHVSWLDWLFLGAVLDNDWKFVVSSASAQTSWIHRKIMINRRTFPIDTTSPYGVKHMAEFLEKGGRLVLFSEGRISRTGSLMKLFDGTGFLLFKTRAKVITCYLRGAHRLPLSPNRDHHRWFPPISVHFGEVLTPPHPLGISTTEAREVLTRWLRDRMIEHQFRTEMKFGPATVPAAILEMARARPRHRVMMDLSRSMTYRQILTGAVALAEVFRKVLPVEDKQVGVLLPNVNAMPVTLLALWSLGRVPAILNYSSGPAVMLSCARLAGLKCVITSKVFLEKAALAVDGFLTAGIEMIYLEDLRRGIRLPQKLAAALRARFEPRLLLNPLLTSSNTAVFLFTSGSEGTPKGVNLSHGNLLANIRQMLAVSDLHDRDKIFNALPLFHSFGLTIGTLTPLVRGMSVFLYPSPLHYRLLPTIFYFSDSTILLATNSFLNGYARKAHPYEFRSLRYLFAGAEKVQETTVKVWAEKFGVRVLEGYGATECSPCLSVSLPMEPKTGTAGRLLPLIECRMEPVDGVPRGGRLLVRGPNVMKGYLNPEANEKFQALGGWYDTGDIVEVDGEGYVHVLGRLKRFAKVSGEMVSLTAIEEALAGAFPQFGLRCQLVVISQPDPIKGETLICVCNESRVTLEQVRTVLRGRGFSNLCVPREIKYLRDLPKLGTGKVDHRSLEKLI